MNRLPRSSWAKAVSGTRQGVATPSVVQSARCSGLGVLGTPYSIIGVFWGHHTQLSGVFWGHHTQWGVLGTPYSIIATSYVWGVLGTPYSIIARCSGDTILNYRQVFWGHHTQLSPRVMYGVPGMGVASPEWVEIEGKKDQEILGAAVNPQPRWPWSTATDFAGRLGEASEHRTQREELRGRSAR